jgi:hypothetical protein
MFRKGRREERIEQKDAKGAKGETKEKMPSRTYLRRYVQ